METISQVSSIITLISFVLYFIGRIIKVKLNKKVRYENIEIYYYGQENELFNKKIVAEFNICDFNTEKLIISSEVPINWIRLYKLKFDEGVNDMKKEEILLIKELLKNGHAI